MRYNLAVKRKKATRRKVLEPAAAMDSVEP
jgi:hypothetical protein